jgi:hypothetical protein
VPALTGPITAGTSNSASPGAVQNPVGQADVACRQAARRRGSWSETSRHTAPRASLTERARREVSGPTVRQADNGLQGSQPRVSCVCSTHRMTSPRPSETTCCGTSYAGPRSPVDPLTSLSRTRTELSVGRRASLRSERTCAEGAGSTKRRRPAGSGSAGTSSAWSCPPLGDELDSVTASAEVSFPIARPERERPTPLSGSERCDGPRSDREAGRRSGWR